MLKFCPLREENWEKDLPSQFQARWRRGSSVGDVGIGGQGG